MWTQKLSVISLIQHTKLKQGCPEGIKRQWSEGICERDEFSACSERLRKWQMVKAKVVTVMRWYVQDEVNQEREQNKVDSMKKGADSTCKVMHI